MQTNNETEIATVPLVALESMRARNASIIHSLVLGWCVSIFALAAVIVSAVVA